jgi:hypothetical protein
VTVPAYANYYTEIKEVMVRSDTFAPWDSDCNSPDLVLLEGFEGFLLGYPDPTSDFDHRYDASVDQIPDSPDWRLDNHSKSLDSHQLWFQGRRQLGFDTHKAPFGVDSEASQGEII